MPLGSVKKTSCYSTILFILSPVRQSNAARTCSSTESLSNTSPKSITKTGIKPAMRFVQTLTLLVILFFPTPPSIDDEHIKTQKT